MSNQLIEPTTARHRLALAIGIVVLSIVLPVVVVGWSVLAEMRDKGVAAFPSKIVRTFYGTVKRGELWHVEITAVDENSPPARCRLRRLDLETGAERDSELSLPAELGSLVWLGESLYYITVQSKSVYRLSPSGCVKLATLPAQPAKFHCPVFTWGGLLTTIHRNADGSSRLTHLVEGRWIEGRPILLPEVTRTWHDDAELGRRVLLPLTTQPPPLPTTPLLGSDYIDIQVEQRGQQHHVTISNSHMFAAYRTGFEFADEATETPSALAPENALRDVTGWEPIGGKELESDRSYFEMSTAPDGVLFLSRNHDRLLLHRDLNGVWNSIAIRATNMHFPDLMVVGQDDFDQRDNSKRKSGFVDHISDTKEAAAFLIERDGYWGSIRIRRIKGSTIDEVHYSHPGCKPEYLARWRRIGVSLLVAWMLHIVVLIGGAAWLTRGVLSSSFEFGNQWVTLAPSWRRALATSFDVALLVVFASLLGRSLFNGLGIFSGLGIEATDFDESPVAHGLLFVEQLLNSVLLGTRSFSADPGFWLSIPRLLHRIGDFPDLIGYFGATLFVACGVKVFVEGRFGITPGKWLLGLRTVRTTLRPCGFARALVRNVLYYVDLPLLLTPLPAAISLMFSDHRQRLGDRVADTIVVRAGSMREAG